MPIQVARNGIRGLLYGDGNRVELRYLPLNADVKEGDMLVTSGLGGVFPAGLNVARVSLVERDAGRTFATIQSEPVGLVDRGRFALVLPRAERELAATVASKINGCIYCASVHARKASQLSKDDATVEALLAVRPGQSLSEGQSARWQAEINFAAALSVTPPAATPLHLAALEKEGLDTLAQLDLVQSAAFFAWANRLMLTLGEPWLA